MDFQFSLIFLVIFEKKIPKRGQMSWNWCNLSGEHDFLAEFGSKAKIDRGAPGAPPHTWRALSDVTLARVNYIDANKDKNLWRCGLGRKGATPIFSKTVLIILIHPVQPFAVLHFPLYSDNDYHSQQLCPWHSVTLRSTVWDQLFWTVTCTAKLHWEM